MKIAVVILCLVSVVSTASAIYYSREEDRLRSALDKDKIVKSLRNHLEEAEYNLLTCQHARDVFVVDIEMYIGEIENYKNQVQALTDACERKDRQIKILSAK